MSTNENRRLVIEAGKTEQRYWADLWRYRELFYFLSWRDILVRYKQTVIGVLWAVLRPVLTMVVFTVVFGKWAKMPSEGVPYPVLVFAAMLPWQFFASSLTESSNSLITNANMISKVYFPRLVMPVSAVIVSLVDFFISFSVLIVLMLFYGVPFTFKLFSLFLFLPLAFVVSLAASLWLAALNVEYRDFRYIVPFIVQFGMYISPVGFSSSVVPAKWRLLYSLNPMVGVIDGFRWAVAGVHISIYWPGFLVSMAVVVLMLAGGVWYFRRMERTFADVI